ncbi:MAG: VWA domain-containing protein [Puniceicoccales bacterium]|jgi:Ca-activated chloride channel family protein|nr:VWA domain-containing protein [Puniceicoccales bacterium]
MTHYTFGAPLWLFGFLLFPLVFWLRRRRGVLVGVVPFAGAWHRPGAGRGLRLPLWFATLGAAFVVVALARPQRVEERRDVNAQGYDLMLAIDLSTSMLAEDYERGGRRLNRLQTIRPVIKAFIEERTGDRIGIVVFAGGAYTLAPLTTDRAWLGRQVERLHTGLVEDGTAIGDGLGVALSRLEQPARSVVSDATGGAGVRRLGAFVILLTDGSNNCGTLAPRQASAIAKARGIPVYTVGVGRNGVVPFPVFDREGMRVGSRRVNSDIDEEVLRAMADETGGRYFRADETGTVEAAFGAIDKARKIEFQARAQWFVTELFGWFAAAGGVFVLLGARWRFVRGRPVA